MGNTELNTANLASILKLEGVMKSMEGIDLDAKHFFGGGVYARWLFIPKGTVLTGKTHKTETMNIMLYGDIEVATPDGNSRITEPCVIISEAGTKRAGFVHEDTVWITLHSTKEQDLETIEKEFIKEDLNDLIEE
tara:strand:- start:871 stop:1275 length:405 start_codon:yes stop_codon:yes gene_type:complete